MRIPGPPPTVRFRRPGGLDRLGFPPAVFGREGGISWMVQETREGAAYAVVVGRRQAEGETQLAVAVTASADGSDPLRLGRARVDRALAAGTGFQPGSVFSCGDGFSHFIRLSFAHYSEQEIATGIERLAGLLK